MRPNPDPGSMLIGGVVGALVGGVAATALAAPHAGGGAGGGPSIPATLPDGQATLPGASFTWWYIVALDFQNAPHPGKTAVLVFTDQVSAMILMDAISAAASAAQQQTLKLYALVNGSWTEVKK